LPDITAKPFTIAQMTFIMLHNEKPLDDVKVRQALNYATDKEAINKAVYLLAKVASADPAGMYQATDLPGYPFD
jgi:ABC-type transport system substrate-binding protein